MILIRGGTVLSVGSGVIEDGSVLIGDDGKIADVFAGRRDVPGAEVVDAVGKVVTPGFVDAHTHLGICNLEVGEIGEDENEMTNPATRVPCHRRRVHLGFWILRRTLRRRDNGIHGTWERQCDWRTEHHHENCRPLARGYGAAEPRWSEDRLWGESKAGLQDEEPTTEYAHGNGQGTEGGTAQSS